MNRLVLMILWCLLLLNANAQEPPLQIQQQLEDLAGAMEDDLPEDGQYLQLLHHLKSHPLDINSAGAEQFNQLRMLNVLQIDHLLKYRRLLGLFINIYELQAVPHWDVATIFKVLPFITAEPAGSIKEGLYSRLRGEHYVLFKMGRMLQKPEGYDTSVNNHYLGDRNQILIRYRYQYKDLLYFGITGDKDAGEPFFKGIQSKGFDFYSFHLFARRAGIIRSLALGDYTVNLGQGLIQWHSMGFSKSSDVMNIKRQAPVLMPYRSAGEFYFNRGCALTIEKGRLESSLFVSRKKTDGNIGDSSRTFSRFLTSGLHRNPNEISDRNQILLTTLGANLKYSFSGLKTGLNMIHHQLDVPLEKKAEPYSQFAFSGRHLINYSLDYAYTYNNVHAFGEAALDKNGRTAVVMGAIMSVDPRIDLSLLYRDIDHRYQSLSGNAFTESTLPGNERGIYMGMSVKAGDRWKVDAYGDFYFFPWLKYRVNSPSRGHDFMLQMNFKPNRQFDFYTRFRWETRPVNGNGNEVIHYPEGKSREHLRAHFSAQISRSWDLRSRVEMVWFDRKGASREEGFLSYVEAHYTPVARWGGNLRLQYIETDSYNSRIYAYESDVLYGFNLPASFATAFRYYVNLNFKPVKNLRLWFRWAHSIYNEETKETGSGADLIKGNVRSDLRFQVIYSF